MNIYVPGLIITISTSIFFLIFNLVLHKCLPKTISELELEDELFEKDSDESKSKKKLNQRKSH